MWIARIADHATRVTAVIEDEIYVCREGSSG
jgi:hypothetical protein